MFLNGELGPDGLLFDLIVTYSSLEHSGLGRYGDSLNPWADLITMAKAWYLIIHVNSYTQWRSQKFVLGGAVGHF